MGATTAILAYAGGDAAIALRQASAPDPEATLTLVQRAHPGFTVERIGDGTLDNGYPPPDITVAGSLAGLDVLCDRRFLFDRPSQLPTHLLELAAGRRILLHGMHSVVDWLSFAIWENGELIRSLSLGPEHGVIENIGTPLDFELPYWDGEHPVEPMPGWSAEPYSLPFHPLELGEDALEALFGFHIEGIWDPADLHAEDVPLHEFRVVDPSSAEARERERVLRARPPMRRRTFTYGPHGALIETDPAPASGARPSTDGGEGPATGRTAGASLIPQSLTEIVQHLANVV